MNRFMKSARAMVPLLVCLLLAQTTGAAGRKPQAQVTDTKQEVIKFEKEWWEAFKMRDKAALERILADEFLGFDTDTGSGRNCSLIVYSHSRLRRYAQGFPFASLERSWKRRRL